MVNANIDLSQAATGSTALNFGANTPPPDNHNAIATADITLAEIITDAHAVLGSLAHSDVPMADITIDASTAYLVNVFRGITASPVAVFAQATHVWQLLRSQWAPYTRPASIARIPWQRAITASSQTRSVWVYTPRLNASTGATWQQAAPIKTSTQTGWRYPPTQNQSRVTPWQQATATTATAGGTWRYPPRVRNSQVLVFEQATPASATKSLAWFASPTARRLETRIPWQQAAPVISLWPRPDRYTPEPPPPRIITPNLALLCPVDGTGNLKFGFVCGQGQTKPPIIVPIKRIYIVLNNASITRVADGQPLETLSASASIDADSWGWSFNATLSGRMWGEVQPGGTRGDPVALLIEINGQAVAVIVESATRGRSFGKTTMQISGRGIASELAAPFAPVQSFSQTADRTAQQLMNDALTNLGWTIDWQVTDWLVPNGTWQKSGTPMDAITGIAGAIRGMVQADPALKTLHILPRYKVAPWHWPTTTPDVQLPLDPIFVDSLEQDDKPEYNRVFVTGTTGAGRIGQITRDGTAGNLIAPTESDPLITAVEASRQRGDAIIGASGKGYKIGITAPVSDDIPLLQVGQLVQIDPTGESWRGIVRSISLSADTSGGLKVRQQASLEVKA